MSLRSLITALFERVAAEQERTLAPLTNERVLLECGLDSLSVAIVIARLQEKLGTNPFSRQGFKSDPMTFGDFVRLYESLEPATT